MLRNMSKSMWLGAILLAVASWYRILLGCFSQFADLGFARMAH